MGREWGGQMKGWGKGLNVFYLLPVQITPCRRAAALSAAHLRLCCCHSFTCADDSCHAMPAACASFPADVWYELKWRVPLAVGPRRRARASVPASASEGT